MNILILNGGPANGRGQTSREIRDSVAAESRARGLDVATFDLDGMDIKACRGCFACWLDHPGSCTIKDDNEEVLKAQVAAEVIVWITPVTFGGYSAALKKALDRSIPNALPLFVKRHGEIHHPLRYEKQPSLIAIGTLPAPDADDERVFHDLVRRNSINLAAPMTRSLVLNEGADAGTVKRSVTELLDAVGGTR